MGSMLTYHPALDPYHCAFRTLQMCDVLNAITLEVERMRIYDFYLVFPRQIKKVRFPRDFTLLKNSLSLEVNQYDQILNPQRIFERMKPFQSAALRYLVAYGLIDSEEFADKLIRRTEKPIPPSLQERMSEIDEPQLRALEVFQVVFQDLPLVGLGGLKSRTNL